MGQLRTHQRAHKILRRTPRIAIDAAPVQIHPVIRVVVLRGGSAVGTTLHGIAAALCRIVGQFCNKFRHTVAAVQQHVDHLLGRDKLTQAAVIPCPVDGLAVGGDAAFGVDAALTAALNAVQLLLRPQRPEQVDEVFGQRAQLLRGGKVINGVDVLHGVDAVDLALHLHEHGARRAGTHPRGKESGPRVEMVFDGAALQQLRSHAPAVKDQTQLPDGGVLLHVMVFAFVNAPGGIHGGIGVFQTGVVLHIAQRHFQKNTLRLGADQTRLLKAAAAVAQHGAAQLGDIPVKGIPVVAHIGVIDVILTVFDHRGVGGVVKLRFAVVEHAQHKGAQMVGILPCDAGMTRKVGGIHRHTHQRLASVMFPALYDTGVLFGDTHTAFLLWDGSLIG